MKSPLNPMGYSRMDPYQAASEKLPQKRSVNADRSDFGIPFIATDVFNSVMATSEMPDEYRVTAARFVELFRHEQVMLNEGVDSLDFVRECVRRSFGISQVVPFGRDKHRWATDEDIEKIAKGLVELGYKLS